MEEKHPYYIEKTFASWNQFKDFVDKARLEWIYRGQGNSEWALSSSLERSRFDGPIERIASIENQILEEFQRAARHYLPDRFVPRTYPPDQLHLSSKLADPLLCEKEIHEVHKRTNASDYYGMASFRLK